MKPEPWLNSLLVRPEVPGTSHPLPRPSLKNFNASQLLLCVFREFDFGLISRTQWESLGVLFRREELLLSWAPANEILEHDLKMPLPWEMRKARSTKCFYLSPWPGSWFMDLREEIKGSQKPRPLGHRQPLYQSVASTWEKKALLAHWPSYSKLSHVPFPVWWTQ